MPEIQDVPYTNAEDLNKYFYDNFSTTEMIEQLSTQTGLVEPKIFECLLTTGVTASSIAETYYNNNYFNPLYAEAVWKLRLNEMDDCFAFWGFKETLDEPTYNMIESHAGFMVYQGKLYASVADGTYQQRVEIVGIDCTRVENYKIAYDRFSIQPLPYIEENLSLPEIISIKRIWGEPKVLGNYPPKNQVHWIMQYIKNSVGKEKNLKINRFIYKEVYAD